VAPSVQRRKLWLTLTTGVPRRNAAKTRKPFKLARVPQTTGSVSVVSRPKFTILWGHVKDILLLKKFFSDRRYVPYLRRHSPTKLCDGAQMAIFGEFLRPVFSSSRVSDLHLKFALRPHHVCEVWQTSNLRRLRLVIGKKYKEERKKKPQGKNIMVCPIPSAIINENVLLL